MRSCLLQAIVGGSPGRAAPLLTSLFVLATATVAPSLSGARAARAETGPERLSVEAFVERFLSADPRLEVLESRVLEARAAEVEAAVREDPVASYEREETFQGGDGLPSDFVRLAWPVDVSGRVGLRVGAAEAGTAATSAEIELRRAGLVLDALEAFYDAAYARLRVDVLRAERAALGRTLEAVRARTSTGETSGYDLDRLEVEFLDDEERVSRAEGELERARERLALLVGETGDGAAGTSEGRPRFDANDELALPARPAEASVLLDEAFGRRGDVRAARLRIDQAERVDELASRGWVPTPVFTAGMSSVDTGAGRSYGYVAGVALRIPVFDRGQADAARAEAARIEAEAELRVIERRVPALVRSARAELLRRIARAERFSAARLSRLESLLESAEVSWREGERSVTELVDVFRTARAIRLKDLDLRRDARLGELDLWRALGRQPAVEER